MSDYIERKFSSEMIRKIVSSSKMNVEIRKEIRNSSEPWTAMPLDMLLTAACNAAFTSKCPIKIGCAVTNLSNGIIRETCNISGIFENGEQKFPCLDGDFKMTCYHDKSNIGMYEVAKKLVYNKYGDYETVPSYNNTRCRVAEIDGRLATHFSKNYKATMLLVYFSEKDNKFIKCTPCLQTLRYIKDWVNDLYILEPCDDGNYEVVHYTTEILYEKVKAEVEMCVKEPLYAY